jgi:hypothetical protein
MIMRGTIIIMQVPATISSQEIPVRRWGFTRNRYIHEPHYKEKNLYRRCVLQSSQEEARYERDEFDFRGCCQQDGGKLKTMHFIQV